MTLIEIVQAKVDEAQAAYDEANKRMADITSACEVRGEDLNADEAAKFNEARNARAKAEGDLAELRDRANVLREEEARKAAAAAVRPESATVPAFAKGTHNEPRTYRADNGHETKFFADAYRAENLHDRGAQDRIERHMRETEVEYRDITSSTLNGLVPPRYLLEQAATLARAMRPLADLIPSYPLPDTGMTMYVTKVSTGTLTAVQTSQNTAVQEQDIVTTDVSIPVVTIAGVQDVSRQALERGAVTDSLIMADLAADYATRLDYQLISGSGSNGQHTGYLNTGAVTASFTGTTIAAFYSKLVGMLSGVAAGRFAPATLIVMSPRRWHWLLAAADTAGRPLVVPNPGAGFNVIGTGASTVSQIAGTLAGIPVVVDANVSLVEGASTNEDRVIVTRHLDAALWENQAMTFHFEQFITPPTTIRLAVWGYSGFTAQRYTAGVQLMVGTGLVAPSF